MLKVRVDLLSHLAQHSIQEYLSDRGLLTNTSQIFFGNQEFYSYLLSQDEYNARIRAVQDDVTARMAQAVVAATNYSLMPQSSSCLPRLPCYLYCTYSLRASSR